MSGGHFNYHDASLKNEIFDYEDTASNQFEDLEISQLVFDVLTLVHDYDWYASGDTGRADWLRAKDLFKNKWLKGERTKNLEAIIDAKLAEVRAELKETIK